MREAVGMTYEGEMVELEGRCLENWRLRSTMLC